MKSTMKSTQEECVIDERYMAEFDQVATIRDKLAFSALVARYADAAVEQALARQGHGTTTANSPFPSFRAERRWEPSATELQRGRLLMLKEFRKPHNLPVAKYAELAGKSRQQLYEDIKKHRLLALSIGARGQHIPDWQLDKPKQALTAELLKKAPTVDAWTLYYALSEPNRDFAGKAPIEIVSPGNLSQVLDTLLSQLGIHV